MLNSLATTTSVSSFKAKDFVGFSLDLGQKWLKDILFGFEELEVCLIEWYVIFEGLDYI